jgi:hypothetical protein
MILLHIQVHLKLDFVAENLDDVNGQENTKKVLIVENQKVFLKNNIANLVVKNPENLEKHVVFENKNKVKNIQ